jgi:hypothetical protein
MPVVSIGLSPGKGRRSLCLSLSWIVGRVDIGDARRPNPVDLKVESPREHGQVLVHRMPVGHHLVVGRDLQPVGIRPGFGRVALHDRHLGAGHQALERSAYAEAVSHLTTALDLLTTLPEMRERSQQELDVLMILGMAWHATKGSGAPEMESLYTRARELYERVGEPPQLFGVLRGLWSVHSGRGESQAMQALGEQLLSLAQRLEDPDLLLEAHHSLCGPACSLAASLLPPKHTWNRADGSMIRNGTAPMPRSTADMTLECVAT